MKPPRAGPTITAIWNDEDEIAMPRGSCSLETRSGTKARKAGPEKARAVPKIASRSEEHTSELQSLMRISYAVFCLKKKKKKTIKPDSNCTIQLEHQINN